MFLKSFLVFVGSAVVAAAAGAAAPVRDLDSRLGIYEGTGGTSCSHLIMEVLPWRHALGDWRDALGVEQGAKPFASERPEVLGAAWDVTKLVSQWSERKATLGAFLLRQVDGQGYAAFKSREARDVADRPMLVLEFADRGRKILEPSADTQLDCSSYRALGKGETLTVSRQTNVALQFALPDELSGSRLVRARLVLSSARSVASAASVGVFELSFPRFPSGPVQNGIAAGYPGDRGVERDPSVIFATGFDESLSWRSRWAVGSSGGEEVGRDDPALRFQALDGAALRVGFKKGRNDGADLRYALKEAGGEPEELFFRYYVRLADDWNPTLDGGKMPGLAGTYSVAGWGGRRSDGTNGWSLRGNFHRAFPKDHPFFGLTQLGTYAYHADMASPYGDNWYWPGALLERNRWYCVEQQVRMNRPDAADGVLRVWLDGRQIFEKTDLRLRKVDRLRIETAWLNVYHGGIDPSPHDQHMFFDDIVVARRYIGPRRPGP